MKLETLQRKMHLNAFSLKRTGKSRNQRPWLINLLIIVLLFGSHNAFSQRNMEYLTRGLVAVNTSDYVFVSWRIFSTDADSVQFNLYRDGSLLNESPISELSNYADSSGTKNSIYYLETVYNSGRTEISSPVAVWEKEYSSIDLQLPDASYYPNDASIGDLNGDGEMEIIVKMQNANPDVGSTGYLLDPVYLQAYKLNGSFLWSINLGRNIRAGAHYTQFMVYDLDNDGIAEIACKTAPGTKDGTGNYLSKGPAATDDDEADYRIPSGDDIGKILSGPEYLTVFNGLTGAEITTVEYIPVRGNLGDWGDTWGNRSERFLAGVAYLDGVNPSLIMCRGYYAKTVLAAWDFDGTNLSSRWVFDTDIAYPTYAGQGNHQLSIADGDNDGYDEIYYGAMAIDHDGTGLWNTRHGHGDAMHVSDIDPEHPGLEKWGVYEGSNAPGSALLDAKTGEILWATPITPDDVGRGVSADVSADFLGMECWGGTNGLRSCKDEYVGRSPSSANFVIWWDDDLVRELLDGISISKYDPDALIDPKIMTATDCMSNNGTKSTPNLSGDIFGDWREELILRTEDNTQLRIYTTTTPTAHGIYTLLQDPQYRLALAWQNVSYNQPPHPGFYLGDGMDTPPIPNINVRKANISSINITSPTNNFELGLGLDLNISVHATALSESNSDIVIWQDGVAVDTISEAPYYSTIVGLTSGDYTFVATALDSEESTMKSDTVHITVDEGYPHVAITSPENGVNFLPADLIPVAAEAYDTDGNIDSVTFFSNSKRLVSFTTLPYSAEVENPGVGTFEIKAVAYDNDGKSTESEIVTIAVGVVNTIQEGDTGYCGLNNGEGWIESNNVGFTGDGFVNTDNIPGVQVVWAVDFPETGAYKFEWRYACSESRPGILLLNDENVSDVPFVSTVDYTTWEIIYLNANVTEGINKVTLEANHSKGLPNIDYLKVYSLDSEQEINGLICDAIVSSDSTLADLSVNGATLAPSFDKQTLNYSVDLPSGTTRMTIKATPSDPNATVTGAGTVNISQSSGSTDVVVVAENGTSTLTYTINYNVLVSVNDVSVEGLNIYPLPAKDYMMVETDNDEIINDISVYTIDGRKVLSESMINSNEARIEFAEVQNGVYLIQVNTNKKTYSGKIVVRK